MEHSPGFLALVEDAKRRVPEFSIPEFCARLEAGERYILLDTREDHEWSQGHLPGAHHMSRGTIERDIEQAIPDKDAPIVLYCRGGYRSALAADNLQRMGYTHVINLAGGWRAWIESSLPVIVPGAAEPANR